jgi:hypothetical protein
VTQFGRHLLRLFVAVLAAFFLLQPSAALASTGNLDCADFGSRERAQFEMDKNSFDVHGLDGDDDGRACEWNASTGWWGWPMSAIAMAVGRFSARRKKADHRVVPGWRGFWNNFVFHEDGGVDTVIDRGLFYCLAGGAVALPVVTMLRDYALPRSFTALTINFFAAAVLGVSAFVYTWRTNHIDTYR